MALVFFTLGLVIVAMIVLTKLPWLRAKAQQEASPQTTAGAPVKVAPVKSAQPSDDLADDELARIAAIALALLRTGHRARAYVQTEATRSAWKNYGRANQLGL
jgi:hypothetical protein